jgi:hypothetical protein
VKRFVTASFLYFAIPAQAAERVLTHEPHGHQIHNTQVFSPDGRHIVFDWRNDETQIGPTSRIGLAEVATGAETVIYQAVHPSEFGPGLGAATFSPVAREVVFIHGLANADAAHPYAADRRTAALVALDRPGIFTHLDARDVTPPFTPGALRGGTHAHNWSADGTLLSCTYNDAVFPTLAAPDDLRTVAVIVRGKPVTVAEPTASEDFSGSGYAVNVVPITRHPAPGSDEISRAYDEGWVGIDGYLRSDGTRQRRALAFIGNVTAADGNSHSEVFLADLPDDLSQPAAAPLEGTATSFPAPPAGVHIRRLTRTDATPQPGLQGPRHWLRSSPDGATIAFLDADDDGFIQIFGVAPTGGPIRQISRLKSSVETPINWSPDGKFIACAAGGKIVCVNVVNGKGDNLTSDSTPGQQPCNGVVFSPDGKWLAFNRKLPHPDGHSYFQICLVAATPQDVP